MWGVASLLAGKSQGLFGAAVCKIQAIKHYVDSLPLVLKGKKKFLLTSWKVHFYSCLLIVHLIGIWKPSILSYQSGQSGFNRTTFFSLVACLVLPISAIAWQTLTQGSQAVDSAFRVFFPTTFCSFKQTNVLSQASPAKGVACEISKQLGSQNQCYITRWVERVDIHTCETLLSGLREALHWPKMVSEAIS